MRTVLLLMEVAVFAASVPALVHVRLDWLGRLLEPRGRTVDPYLSPRDVAAVVDRVLQIGRPWLQPGCLVRGLTRYYFLRRAGTPVSLCFGIRMHASQTLGHCWLELAGEPFLEVSDPRPVFTEMYRFPVER